ncbi:hypothetical protein [Brachybacterium sp. ACRRE]|uniref:hypothetical protein n=1 Tax=Brachybacterium sp. ACRRE TaxID=2918184 RepID=UPI001EF1766E|nr:hypothetical protein [Brachybacterium sp. ACRRE]MCG7308011.1 hypothetical protein [Brachybacterium sp. ACRRE]
MEQRFTIHWNGTGAHLKLRLSPAATIALDLNSTEVDQLRTLLSPPQESTPATPFAARPTSPKPATPDSPNLPNASAPEELAIFDTAVPHMARLGLDRRDLAHILDDPEDEWVDQRGVAAVIVRGDHAIVVGLRDHVIMSVMDSRRAYTRRPRDSEPVPRHHGGSGTRYPTSVPELWNVLRDRGAEVSRTGGGHIEAVYQGKRCTMASTPLDRRSLRNAITHMERTLGLDLRRDPR